ncbi:MAG TPA: nuclear transport factor 2 family protein [Solirubrobacteraceae bacterium]|nr:nuclear transport factor 2 family protein [Solirubrobacteraceae bacterium]
MGEDLRQAERDIVRLIRDAWAAIDRKDWDGYANAFATDGEFEIMGQRRRGRAEIVAGPARDLAKYDRLQHLIMNEIVDVDGDRARGSWYAIAVHVPNAAEPEVHADVGLRYAFQARREDGAWRLAEAVIDVIWASGMSFAVESQPAAG